MQRLTTGAVSVRHETHGEQRAGAGVQAVVGMTACGGSEWKQVFLMREMMARGQFPFCHDVGVPRGRPFVHAQTGWPNGPFRRPLAVMRTRAPYTQLDPPGHSQAAPSSSRAARGQGWTRLWARKSLNQSNVWWHALQETRLHPGGGR